MTYKIYPATDLNESYSTLLQLHTACFPKGTPWPFREGHWWIAQDDSSQNVAFAGLHIANHDEGHGILCRAGVLPTARGAGLQRKLIDIRVAKARKLKLVRLTTYVHCENPWSANNVLDAGFRMYQPSAGWGEAGFTYWEKTL